VVDEAPPADRAQTMSAFVRIECPESAVLGVRIRSYSVSGFSRIAQLLDQRDEVGR
jgi:hypothetical protein